MTDIDGLALEKTGNGVSITADMIIAAIDKRRGNLAAVARDLHCSRQTIYNRMKDAPTIRRTFEQAREKMLDDVEQVLYDKALAGEAWAVCFFLKTQGKGRGYIERQELTGVDGHEITFKVIYADRNHAADTAQ